MKRGYDRREVADALMFPSLPRSLANTLSDPALDRATILPVGRRTFTDPGDDITEERSLEFALPGLLYDPLMGAARVSDMFAGAAPVDPDAVTQFMIDAPFAAGVLSAATGAAPKGAVLGANVFHGGPHRFAPEPDFPHGRPRLDKIGTGEGSQAFGWGFYSADSPRVAETYRKSLDNLAQTLDLKNPVDRSVGFLRFQHSKDEIKDQLKKEFGGSPEDLEGWYQAGKSKFENVGTLYKLDIPDADIAKYLDYDKPLSEQPESVRRLAVEHLGIPSINHPAMSDYTGASLHGTLSLKMGKKEVSDLYNSQGIPGLKYFDQGSRAGGEGTRNYVTWDQDVLDRSKMLERDGVTLGANKSSTAALPGLLSDIRPAKENIRTVIDANTIGGDVVGDETVPIGLLSGGASSSARAQKAIDDIAESMSGPEGFIERLIVDQDNNVIEGAHRLEALRKLGVDEVPVTRIVDPQASFTPDTKVAMRAAIQKAKKTNSDYENQIISQLGEMLADPDVAGDPKKVFEVYDPAKGFEDQFRAALKVIESGGI